jgi:hypothetical protein
MVNNFNAQGREKPQLWMPFNSDKDWPTMTTLTIACNAGDNYMKPLAGVDQGKALTH